MGSAAVEAVEVVRPGPGTSAPARAHPVALDELAHVLRPVDAAAEGVEGRWAAAEPFCEWKSVTAATTTTTTTATTATTTATATASSASEASITTSAYCYDNHCYNCDHCSTRCYVVLFN